MILRFKKIRDLKLVQINLLLPIRGERYPLFLDVFRIGTTPFERKKEGRCQKPTEETVW